ncbi:MAG: hypothetical protein AB1796_06450 [Bacillota bacterium]
MTFSDLSMNQNNLIRVKIPLPPVEPACLKVDRVCSSCRKTANIFDYWIYNHIDPPTPCPPEKIKSFFLYDPVITGLHSFYLEKEKGFFISVLFCFDITVVYLDQKNNRGVLRLTHSSETVTWLESPPEATPTAAICGEVISYELKNQEWDGGISSTTGKNKTILYYTIGLTFDFFSLQKVKLLVPTFGPCLPPLKCSSPDFYWNKPFRQVV